MRVVFLGLNSSDEGEYLKKHLKDHSVNFFTNTDYNLTDQSDCQILGVRHKVSVDQTLLKKLVNLNLVCAMSTGVDNIDLEFCRKRGVRVVNVPSYGENTVAEYAFALLLSVSRKIRQVVCLDGRKINYDDLRGIDLFGKTIGIIGTGRIGSKIARIASGFGMKLLAFDKISNKELIKNCKAEYKPLKEVLTQSDIVILSLPLMPETRHILNEESIPLMKKGATLINIGRGELIDTFALARAIKEGCLAGAGLDVLEEEKAFWESNNQKPIDNDIFNANHFLADCNNVILSPHNAFNTEESGKRILDITIENILNFEAEAGDSNRIV